MIIDARGLPCPQPVVMTKKAMEKASDLTVIVDNATAEENVSRLAEGHGMEVKVDEWGIDAAYSGTQKCLSCPPGCQGSPSLTARSSAKLTAVRARSASCDRGSCAGGGVRRR